MTILLVEDDENKRNQIVGFMGEEYPVSSIKVAKSLQSGLRALISGEIDLALLDMTLPTYDITPEEDGGRIHAFGGREILQQMIRRAISTPVIVITQYEKFGEGVRSLTLTELDEELRRSYPGVYLGIVCYKVGLEGWKNALSNIIETSGGVAGSA